MDGIWSTTNSPIQRTTYPPTSASLPLHSSISFSALERGEKKKWGSPYIFPSSLLLSPHLNHLLSLFLTFSPLPNKQPPQLCPLHFFYIKKKTGKSKKPTKVFIPFHFNKTNGLGESCVCKKKKKKQKKRKTRYSSPAQHFLTANSKKKKKKAFTSESPPG